MKDHTISLRIPAEEYEKLKQSAALENTTVSQFIRDVIKGIEPRGGKDLQVIATYLCKIYIELSRQGFDNSNEVLERIEKICQSLY